jgi:pilus assembly protein Flp/PilA
MLKKFVRQFAIEETGATAIEYSLIAVLIAIGIVGSLSVFGGGLANLFNFVADSTGNAMANAGH